MTPGELMAETPPIGGLGLARHQPGRLHLVHAVGHRARAHRVVRVRLTARGMRAVDSALANLLERERSLLLSLTLKEQARLARLLRSLLEPFDQDRDVHSAADSPIGGH